MKPEDLIIGAIYRHVRDRYFKFRLDKINNRVCELTCIEARPGDKRLWPGKQCKTSIDTILNHYCLYYTIEGFEV